ISADGGASQFRARTYQLTVGGRVDSVALTWGRRERSARGRLEMVEFSDIEEAREAIREHIYLTPCAYSATLSAMSGNKVYLKLENLQMTGSYKERGALNRLRMLDAERRARGVVAASAGNHAQGVAFHARRLGISA